MTLAVNVFGWAGVVALLSAYWLVSAQRTSGDSKTYQGLNLLGAILVLVNSSYYGAYPSVGVNAAWIAIGAYTLTKHLPTIAGGTSRTPPVVPQLSFVADPLSGQLPKRPPKEGPNRCPR